MIADTRTFETKLLSSETIGSDIKAGVVVFLVALPLCLGIAVASNAPPFAGVVAGIVGGIVVGLASGSHTSVSGPAAGLTAIVMAQQAALGSFEAFLLAVVFAGVLQIGLGLARAGFLAVFFPSSVIKGLLAAIGLILVLKQIPHIFGHDADPEGEMSYHQPDHETTFSEIGRVLYDIHPGAMTVGFLSIALLLFWDWFKPLKNSLFPAPLAVVLFGVGMAVVFQRWGGSWAIGGNHLVEVPVSSSIKGFFASFTSPDFSQWTNPLIYSAAVTIALVASLETLLNLEAVDKLDPKQRTSPPSRELLAQGVGNMAAGLLGGLPITSVIVRGSVNVNAGGQTKLAAVFHGLLLLFSVMLLPTWLNMIPMACLAAILLLTGFKLASPKLFKRMWDEGPYQFIPFASTVVAIVFTDLLKGILIGLGVSISFILYSNLRRPLRRSLEKHLGGEVLRIELAEQVSFLKRGSLMKVLDAVPRGGHVLIDAQDTDYIDPDILDLLRDFKEQTAPARGVEVSFVGFRKKYQIEDRIQYIDYSTRELQAALTPDEVLQILKDGHERFRSGQRLNRDFNRQVSATAQSQHPLAVVLSCIDSRVPAELIFDLGVGDIFSVRVAGNITSRKVLGSIEYGCAAAGAKLVLVMGHTRCGAVTTAVNLADSPEPAVEATGCQHIDHVLDAIQESVEPEMLSQLVDATEEEKRALVDEVARLNVQRTVERLVEQSQTLAELKEQGRIAIVGAMYDVATGEITFLPDPRLDRQAVASLTG